MDVPLYMVILSGLALFLIGFQVGRGWVPFWTAFAEKRAAELEGPARRWDDGNVARWGLALQLRCGEVGHLTVHECEGGYIHGGPSTPVERTAIDAAVDNEDRYVAFVVDLDAPRNRNGKGAPCASPERDGPETGSAA